MLEQNFAIFNLSTDSSLTEVKKAYKKLAKLNHPDLFTDENIKKIQQNKMSQINEAYQVIIKYYKKNNPEKLKSNIENDYSLYKEAIKTYNKYFDLFFKLFSKRELKGIDEKEINLKRSRSIFQKLIEEYPKSIWVFDSKEKIKNINKALDSITNSKKSYDNLKIKDSKFY